MTDEQRGRGRTGTAAALPILCILLLCASAGPARAAKRYQAESYRSEVRLETDGALHVRETVRMRFEGGPFTFFRRIVPSRHTESIELISASDSTVVRGRKGLDVTWQFRPLHDADRTFVLEYRVRGAIAVEKDRLRYRWIPFPQERPYTIDAAEAEFVLPPGSSEPLSVRVHPSDVALRGGTSPDIVLEPLRLKSGHTVFIDIDLAPSTAAVTMPQWQKQILRWKKNTPWLLGLAGLLLLGGLGVVLNQRERVRSALPRPVQSAGAASSPVPSPPEALSPALAGALAQGYTTLPHVIGTVFDLASRGLLRLEEVPRRFLGTRAPELRVLKTPPEAAPWERVLLEAVLYKSKEPGVNPWSRAQSGINRSFGRYRTEVMKALEERGDRDPAAGAATRKFRVTANVMLAAAALLLVPAVLLFNAFGPAVLAPSVALFLTVGAARIIAQTFPQWTPRGAEEARAWKGFSNFLKESAKPGRIDTSHFEEYLPYAVALGQGQVWIKAGKRSGAALPPWYQPLPDSSGDFAPLLVVIAAAASGSHAGGGGAPGGSSSAG